MAIDSVKRNQLVKQIKRGRQNGALGWTRLLLILGAAVEIYRMVSDVHRGTATLGTVSGAMIIVFILAVATLGLVTLDINERFSALLELTGDDREM